MRLLPAIFAVFLVGPAAADDFAPMALNSFTAAPVKLQTATVYRQDGELLGNIQGVERGANGLSRLRIGIVGPRTISLPASDASYDPAANVVVAEDASMKAAIAK